MLDIPWRIGANMREFAYYGTRVLAPDVPNTLDLQDIQLRALNAINAKLVRFWASHQNFTTDDSIDRIAIALEKIKKAGMQAIICLDDSVRDSGCFVPGHQDYKPFWGHGHYDVGYYVQEKYHDFYLGHIEKIVSEFSDDPAIFAWELANEPALHPQPFEKEDYNPSRRDSKAFMKYAREASQLIRRHAPNHLISLGLASVLHVISHAHGHTAMLEQAREIYSLDTVDLVSIHFYAEDGSEEEQKRGDWDVAIARQLEKPFYLGEIGATPGRWHGDRAAYHRERFNTWRELGAFAALVWQFNEVSNDLGISDGVSRMHHDFEDIKRAISEFGTNVGPFELQGQKLPGGEVSSSSNIQLRVFDDNQPVFAEPDQDAPRIADDLIRYSLLNVEAGSRHQIDDLVWWRIHGWVVERPVDIEPGADEALLLPNDNPEKKLRFVVVHHKGLNVRSHHSVPADRDANVVGDLQFGDEVGVYAESRVEDIDGYVWWRHDDGLLTGSTSEHVKNGWSAERGPQDVFMERVDDKVLLTRVQFLINKSDQPLYDKPDRNGAILSNSLLRDALIEVDPDSRREQGGLVWWRMSAWVVERHKDVAESSTEAPLQPFDPNIVAQFRVAQPGHGIHVESSESSNQLTNRLAQDAVIEVDVRSRTEQDNLVWWQVSGWVVERATEIQENAPGARLHREEPVRKLWFQVVTKDDLNVRSHHEIPRPDRKANIVGDLKQGDIVEVYADSRVEQDDYVWWKHDDGIREGTASEKIIGGWSAERNFEGTSVLMERLPDPEVAPHVQFRVVQSDQPIYTWPDITSTQIADGFTPDTLIDVNPASRVERHGLIWWQVNGWVVERSLFAGAGEPGTRLHPVHESNVKQLRVVQDNQPVFARPDRESTKIGDALTPNLLIDVSPMSRMEKDGLVWWSVNGWVVEKELKEDGAGPAPDPLLEQLPYPPREKLKFRVVWADDLYVRSDHLIPEDDPKSNIVGDLKQGNVINVFKESRAVDAAGYIWWKHDDGIKTGAFDEKVEGGWSAELGPSMVFMERVDDEPPITQFRVIQAGQPIFMGPGRNRAKLVNELQQDAILEADTRSRRVIDGIVWWKVSGWIVERGTDEPARSDDVALYPTSNMNVTQFHVTHDEQSLFAGPGKEQPQLSSELTQGVIIDVETRSRVKNDDLVWWQLSGWVVERTIDTDETTSEVFLLKMEDLLANPDRKIRFEVVTSDDLWVRSEPVKASGAKDNRVGDLKSGDIVEAFANSRQVSKDGYVWWKHDDGIKSGTSDENVKNGWSAERNEHTGEILMKPLDDEADRLQLPFRVVQANQAICAWPKKSGAPVTNELVKDSVISVDPDSRLETDGLVWWKMKGWVIERSGTVPTGSPSAHMQLAKPPELVCFQVVHPEDLWVRSAPFIPPDYTANVIGDLWTGDVIEAYAESCTLRNGYVWWRHDSGRTLDHANGIVVDGWSAEYEESNKADPLMRKCAPGGGMRIEEFCNQPEGVKINVNTLWGRDNLFDRIPVEYRVCYNLQHYGNTTEAFDSERYIPSKMPFQGLHPGIDFGITNGKTSEAASMVPVVAGVAGIVVEASTRSYRPYHVRVQAGPLLIIYGHMSVNGPQWNKGDKIEVGTEIGFIANWDELKISGPDFWPHLHLEVRLSKIEPHHILNPLMFFPSPLRQKIIRAHNVPALDKHFYQSDTWAEWGTILCQPIIILDGPLIGPLTSKGG